MPTSKEITDSFSTKAGALIEDAAILRNTAANNLDDVKKLMAQYKHELLKALNKTTEVLADTQIKLNKHIKHQQQRSSLQQQNNTLKAKIEELTIMKNRNHQASNSVWSETKPLLLATIPLIPILIMMLCINIIPFLIISACTATIFLGVFATSLVYKVREKLNEYAIERNNVLLEQNSAHIDNIIELETKVIPIYQQQIKDRTQEQSALKYALEEIDSFTQQQQIKEIQDHKPARVNTYTYTEYGFFSNAVLDNETLISQATSPGMCC